MERFYKVNVYKYFVHTFSTVGISEMIRIKNPLECYQSPVLGSVSTDKKTAVKDFM